MPKKSTGALRLWILAIGAALICVFVGSAAYDSWRLHQQIASANERELSNLTKALAEEASRSLQSVDVLLRDTAAWFEANPNQDPQEIVSMLASRVAGVPQVSVVTIVDAQGMQRYRSRMGDEPLHDVSDRPYFLRQRERAVAGLFINEPIVTRTERIPAVVLSRRLVDKNGRFNGVVTAIVTLQQIHSAYSAIDLGAASALLLTQEDGTLIVRQPEAPGLEGKLRFPNLLAARNSGTVRRAPSLMDGRIKLISAVNVGSQPLILAIARDEAQALRPWRDEVRSATIRTALLSLLVLAVMAGLLRQLRRQETGEQALRQSEERYAMAMEAASEGHAEWNVAQDLTFLSGKWRALHGLRADEPLPGSADLKRRLVLHPDDVPAVKAALDDHFAGNTDAIEIEYRVRHADGEWHWIHARGRCLMGSDGKPARLFASAIDVSERKRTEASRLELESRLLQTERLEALGTLAGGIAHDFNNILGAILGFGEMAQHEAKSGSALRRHIDRVMQSGARARLLVRRILDFSRSGVAEKVPVNLRGVMEEVVAMLAPSLPATLRLDVHLDAGDAAVIGDATQLYQVAMNLCTNAVQAMGDEGVITVSLTRHDVTVRRSLLHGDLQPGAYVRLTVGDKGPGIDAATLARMFDPFFTTKKVGEGTGLGLSVVHGIVSDLDGAIDVASSVGEGTTVSVWLRVWGDLVQRAAPAPDAWPNGNGEVVMIVDDERALVDLAEELLAGLGYEPVGYTSSEAALAAFEAEPRRFDAVLTDEMLPVMHGTELARRLLALRPDLPILLMSGNLSEAAEQNARNAGVRTVLHKPLGLRELAENLDALLAKAAA